MDKNYILSPETAARKLKRMAYEILENNFAEKEIILAGIRVNGTVIARNIQSILKEISTLSTELLTVSLDKIKPETVILDKQIPLGNKVVVLIDDVSNSGKTLLYALKPFLDEHPKKIQTLVLVERSHNTFPVKPDYVGLSVATTLQEHIFVDVEGDRIKGAWLE
ncbi:MAG: phosphoribosyltransferase family protein [Bacteroidota bacterium]|nr:phosphoribosyltransferase family protein [Bacteroidota bacterium]MDP4212126.1 phosphoribosyltransferase family protein [Bacteroidota bacterium]MDP4249480.1 phosphoribosyltransferase family protein [Bacteroidota bacterium]